MRAVSAAKGIANRIHRWHRQKYFFIVGKLIVSGRSFQAAKPIAVGTIHPFYFRNNRRALGKMSGAPSREMVPRAGPCPSLRAYVNIITRLIGRLKKSIRIETDKRRNAESLPAAAFARAFFCM